MTLAIAGNPVGYTEASVWVETAVTPYGYTQDIPLLVLGIPPGQPKTVSQSLALDLTYYVGIYGRLNLIDPSGQVAATLTLET